MSAIENIASAEAGIRLYGLSKYYGDFRALDDIDLVVRPSEFLTLLGPSGSGKSTLLMALAGFVDPTHGDLFLGGKSILRLPPEQRNFGVVFQGYALFPHMTAAENIAYPLKVRGLAKNEIGKRVKNTLDLVQLGHLASRYPKQLSGGQQQRVALARALVFSPKVLLLDEPMGALDKKLRHDLQVELRQLHRRLGCTFINVTHDQDEAMAMSDRIAIMRAGKIVQLDEPDKLYNQPKTKFVADFLGKNNFVEGKVARVGNGVADIETADGTVLYEVSERSIVQGASVLLAVRPQRLRFGPGPNSRKAVVQTAMFLGTHVEMTLRSASGQILSATVEAGPAAQFAREGASVDVGWAPAAATLVEAD
ncbi:ABC transporter ATP-binding protein [Caballeronia sp. GAWG2-1]|uniref:ABC transporter ATP-binding protein n=1 Tax=Caballeronia sp. GAWG2-1 TaxID=2921744 RepID=UPI0020293808|nr:ABC transporter ATP-binding protein [Caballeronia sp. GAWG2-1]